MAFIVVLNDNDTYSDVQGAKILDAGTLTGPQIEEGLANGTLRVVEEFDPAFMDLEDANPATRAVFKAAMERGLTEEQIKAWSASKPFYSPEAIYDDKITTVVNEVESMVREYLAEQEPPQEQQAQQQGKGGGNR